MPTTGRVQLGKWGEDSACRALARQGYAILERRHRTRFGEIDIIANDRGVLVFIEVKARRTSTHGTAADALTGHKQRRLLRLALMYLASRRLAHVPCRFDVVTVSLPAGAKHPRVDILKDAFGHNATPNW
jgi:putative endonuclease